MSISLPAATSPPRAGATHKFPKVALRFRLARQSYAFGLWQPGLLELRVQLRRRDGVRLAISATLRCVGQTKDVRQITTGFWHNFYDGPAGKVRVGAQYSYTVRDSFQGCGRRLQGHENTIFGSIRYYPFN